MNVRLNPWSIAMRFEKLKFHLSRVLGFQVRPRRPDQRLSCEGLNQSLYLNALPKIPSS